MLVEELLSLQELLHMDQLVNDVQVDVKYVPVVQVLCADDNVTVVVADSHIPPTPTKFNPKVTEHLLGLFAKESSNNLDILKVLEVLCESVG
jgi:hypothetical protein